MEFNAAFLKENCTLKEQNWLSKLPAFEAVDVRGIKNPWQVVTLLHSVRILPPMWQTPSGLVT